MEFIGFVFFFINSSNGLIEGRETGGTGGIILYSDDFSEEDESLLSLSLFDSDSDSDPDSDSDSDLLIFDLVVFCCWTGFCNCGCALAKVIFCCWTGLASSG